MTEASCSGILTFSREADHIRSDVTGAARHRAAHKAIVQTMLGVLNGAIILRDVTTANISFEQVSKVIRLKVLGNMHLISIFYDVDLDSFFPFSSAICLKWDRLTTRQLIWGW